jgi:hypothetical protein
MRRLLPLLVLAITIAPASQLPRSSDQLAGALVSADLLPVAPDGVTDLRFDEIYKMPAGPQGLELTPKAAALEGCSVRIFGYMARQGQPASGIALLAPYPIRTFEADYGQCDDLPACTVYVVVPKYADIAVPYTPGPLLLTGRFETSPRLESDGRVSHLRLILADEELTPATKAPSAPEPTVSKTAP